MCSFFAVLPPADRERDPSGALGSVGKGFQIFRSGVAHRWVQAQSEKLVHRGRDIAGAMTARGQTNPLKSRENGLCQVPAIFTSMSGTW
jgi:hypothetical protein